MTVKSFPGGPQRHISHEHLAPLCQPGLRSSSGNEEARGSWERWGDEVEGAGHVGSGLIPPLVPQPWAERGSGSAAPNSRPICEEPWGASGLYSEISSRSGVDKGGQRAA